MNDSELKDLFSKMKAEDSAKVPDFDSLLSRPKPVLRKKMKLITVLKWSSVAAAVIFLGLIGYNNLVQNTEKPGESFAEEQEILNWESETDDLLPTEYSQLADNSSVTEDTEINNAQTAINEVKEIARTNPEIRETDYTKGAISDWESPTSSLLPPEIAFSYYME